MMASNTIAIPAVRSSAAAYDQSPKATTSSSSSYSSSPQTPSPSPSEASSVQSARKLKSIHHHRRPSLLSSAFCKDECTVINIGDPDGAPRLISYLASSQGFAWNPELFVPSYVECSYIPLENRREPVHEIRLSDEEIKGMLP